jgi:hypothetical protein
LPAIYVYYRTSQLRQRAATIAALTTFLKFHPVDIMALGLFLGIPCVVALWLLNAPAYLVSAVLALLAGSVVTSLFNLTYRVSFHLTGVTILILLAVHSWNAAYLLLFITVPFIAWSKYKIGDHTIPQLIFGLMVGVAVSAGAIIFIK